MPRMNLALNIVRHEILLGMLSVDGRLIQKYAGMDAATAGQYIWDDRLACEAVRQDRPAGIKTSKPGWLEEDIGDEKK
jgi:hypothetical protein